MPHRSRRRPRLLAIAAVLVFALAAAYAARSYAWRAGAERAVAAAVAAAAADQPSAAGVAVAMSAVDRADATRRPWGDFRAPYETRRARGYHVGGGVGARLDPGARVYVAELAFATGRVYRAEATRAGAGWAVRLALQDRS